MAAHFASPFEEFLCPSDAPSPIFTTFSVVINLIGGIWAAVVSFNPNDQCAHVTRTWAILGVANFFVNGVFALYLYYRFRQKVRGYVSTSSTAIMFESGGGQAPTAPMRPSEAAAKLLLYDWGVCLYIAALIWEVVWCIVAEASYSTSQYPGDACASLLQSCVVILVVYACIGGALIVLSLITECCRQPRWRGQNNNTRTTPYQPPAPATAARAAGAAVGSVLSSGLGALRRVVAPNNAAAANHAAAPPAGTYYNPPSVGEPPAAPVYVRPPPVNPSYQPQHV